MSVNMYRSTLDRLTRERAGLEQDLSREREKIARLQRDISSIKRSIAGSTSPGLVQSKERQLNSKYRQYSSSQRRIAYLETKIAAKGEQISRNLGNLEQAERQEQQRQNSGAKRRRDDELRHARAVTRETERQARVHAQLSTSRFVIDLARLPETITVLFVASNPLDQSALRLDEEMRAIAQQIRASERRDSVRLVASWAARPGDLLQALNEHKPHVVHFSGHGSDADELVFHTDDGTTKLVSKDAIVTTIRTVNDNIRVVVFNACFSNAQAQAVTEHVDAAIGMNTAITDEAARVFAARFYSAIGFGRSLQEAFDQGRAAMLLEGIPEEDAPELYVRNGVDARDIILVRPASLKQPGTWLTE